MAAPKSSFMKLDETPEIVNWPETHYVFIEKIGPFQETAPQAWQAMHQLAATIAEHNQITGYTSLYKVEPKIYRAGVALDSEPTALPEGAQYTKFKGGKYSRFVLTGAYSHLPEACGRVFLIVAEKKIPQRDDFCIENYVNDPRTTPEDELITQILIPTA
jgi:DNA gyrase inhibitor GyrI